MIISGRVLLLTESTSQTAIDLSDPGQTSIGNQCSKNPFSVQVAAGETLTFAHTACGLCLGKPSKHTKRSRGSLKHLRNLGLVYVEHPAASPGGQISEQSRLLSLRPCVDKQMGRPPEDLLEGSGNGASLIIG